MPRISLRYEIQSNYDDFADLCLDLLRRHFQCPTMVKYARGGQKQDGVDLFGVTEEGRIIAGQCKLHEYGQNLRPKDDVQEEVNKAKNFRPTLHEYLILTTAKRDLKIQKLVAEITQDHLKKGLFRVSVMFWDEIEELLNGNPDIADRFYGGLSAIQAKEISRQNVHLQESVDRISEQIAGDAVDARIDEAKEHIERLDIDDAERILQELHKTKFNSCNSRQKFRILANFGHCHERRGEYEDAARFFLEAKDYLPNDKNARFLEIQARGMLREKEKAFELAEQFVEDFPNAPEAWITWISYAEDNVDYEAIEEKFPSHLLTNGDLLYALSRRATRSGLIDKAEDYSRKALQHSPDSFRAREMLAITLLRKYEGLSQTSRIPPSELPRIEEAEQLLLEAINIVGDHSPPFIRAQLRFNHGNALLLLGRDAEAEFEKQTAVRLQPRNGQYAFDLALHLKQQNRIDEAIEVLRVSLQYEIRPLITGLAVELLLDRKKDGDVEEALRMASEALAQETTPEVWERVMLLDKCVDAFVASGEQIDLLNLVQKQQDIPEAAIRALEAKIYLLLDKREEAVDSARKAKQAITAELTIEIKQYVALALQVTGLFADAFDLLKQVVGTNAIDEDTFSFLRCASRCGKDREILDFCRAIRENELYDIRLYDFERDVLERYHEFSECIQISKQYISVLTDEDTIAYIRFCLSRLEIWVGCPDLAERNPENLPKVQSVDPGLGESVVYLFMHLKEHAKAMKYAYALFRRFPDDVESNRALIMTLLLPTEDISHVPESQEVRPGFAVQYVDKDTGEKKWYVVEDSENPDSSRNEFPPDHAIAQELLGKKVGDTFCIRRHPYQDRTGTIKEIISKYVYRFRNCLEHFEERFPHDGTLVRFSVPAKPEKLEDFAPILKSLDDRAEDIEQLESLYRQQPFPLVCVAERLKANVIDTILNLTSKGIDINCCFGAPQEREAALQTLRAANCLVLDSTALATLFLTDAYHYLKEFGVTCVVSEGTLFEFRQDIMRLEDNGVGGSMGKHGDKYYFSNPNPEAVRDRVGKMRFFLQDIESFCEKEGGSAVFALPEKIRQEGPEMLGQSVMESISLAMQPGRVFWTDDMHLAGLACMELGVRRVWTQIVFGHMVEKGIISPEVETRLAINLLKLRYRFTALTPWSMCFGAKEAGYDSEHETLRLIVEHLVSKNIELRSQMNMCALLIKETWQKALSEDLARGVTAKLLRGLSAFDDGDGRILALRRHLDDLFGVDVITAAKVKQYFNVWIRTNRPLIR